MNAAIVIPVYKTIPNESELMSLKQTGKIFENEVIILICPENLDCSEYLKYIPRCKICRFPAEYFKSITGYNRLLLSPVFYSAFLTYDYILITQLDVWVFDNQLKYWCEKDYDYIGAPWLEKPPLTKKINLLPMGKWMYNKVGNGGFSLRKTESHFNIASKLWSISWIFNKNEDFFWSIIVPNIFKKFNIPKLEEAVFFAFEIAPEKAFELTGKKLPFAVHAWQKHNPDFWKSLIPLPLK
ncbi:MAG: hypothetical protein JNK41_03725 [Saprospiraceae bacterium]|jgi:hypothetical protein|nr:hypothetical protein [Saprospiraceae bacterium]